MVGAFLGGDRAGVEGPTIVWTSLVFFLPFLTIVDHIGARVRGDRRAVGWGRLGTGFTSGSEGIFAVTLKGIGVGV